MDVHNSTPAGNSGAAGDQAATTVAEAIRREIAESVAATLDDGRPTGAYWHKLGVDTAMQARVAESIRKMLVFFTVLAVLGLIAGLIIGIVTAVQLHEALNGTSGVDSFYP
ncbi:hypothetical protein [Blastococcus mobilis]|uniref:Uncharacterized protein n=1 Tax=Blastococcus mobilis TaxID=1938746 RepID=A0A239APY4_9ACTN|nr:hypothetical protein [Blastococcus mobilis]SNR97600.1 hypothetical protein SAMN06272737_15212 [Blastococcus mobilis]